MSASKIMGILNITPDSFSDGEAFSEQKILARAEALLTDGAHIIDVGAESTRPGATPLSADEEWQRLSALLPQIIQQAHAKNCQVSLDTRHPKTAASALELGVDIINDVSGFTNPEMLAVVTASACDIVCMHSLTIPADKSVTLAKSADVIQEISAFFQRQLELFSNAGIAKDRIIFDPGLGFAKTPSQSWEILQRIDELKAFGTRLLIGHSRKSFLADITDVPADQCDPLTLVISQYLLEKEVALLRVHNVKLHSELLELTKRLSL